MKKQRIMAMLLAGVMAFSQPLSLLAAETETETVTQVPAEQASGVTANTETETESKATETNAGTQDLSVTHDASEDTSQTTLNADMILPDGHFGTIKVTSTSGYAKDSYLDLQYIDAQLLSGCTAGIKTLAGADKKVTAILPMTMSIQGANFASDYTIRLGTQSDALLDGASLYHQLEDGSWEELTYDNGKLDDSSSYTWTVHSENGWLGNFVFAHVSQETETETQTTETGSASPTQSPDIRIDTETEKETEKKNNGDLTVNDTLPGTPDTSDETNPTEPETELTTETKESEQQTETSSETETATEQQPELTETEPQSNSDGNTESEPATETEAATEPMTEPQTETKAEIETEMETKAEAETESESETEEGVKPEEETETEAETETKTESEAADLQFTYDDDEVTVTANVKAEAGIPETAVLHAEKLEEGSAAYETAMASVKASIHLNGGQELLFVPYDVYFLNQGEKIEPLDGQVDVKMAFKNPIFEGSPDKDETFAAHIKNDGAVERISNTADEKDTVAFEVSSFSVMGPAMIAETGNDSGAANVAPVIIDNYAVIFAGGASKRDGKNVWSPSDPVSAHSFIYRIDYTLSGTFSTDKGAFKIEVPLHILKDRDGNWADTFQCPYPMESELTETDNPEFVYEIDEENNKAYIYNYAPYPAGEAGYVEIAYETTKTTMSYTDMAASTTVPTKIYATNSNSTVTAEATADPVYIDSQATISWTQKKIPTYYAKWQNAWGTKPADADDYVYLVWPIRSYINKNTSPYNFFLNDTFTSFSGSVVGYRFAGQNAYSETNHIDNQTSYGDRYDYVLTRHDKAEAENAMVDYRYEVHNDIEAVVDPIDQVDQDSTATASLDWWYEVPHYVATTGHFWAEKWGVYGGNHIVEDSEDITDYTLTEFYAGDENEINHVKYYTYGEGYPYPWTLGDGADGTVNDALNGLYGQKKVNYDFKDDTFYVENQKLQDTDYEMTSVEWYPSIQGATFNETSYTFIPNYNQTFTKEDNITIWGRKQNDWKQIAVYDLQTKTYKDVDSTYITSAAGRIVSFAEGVKGVRFTCSNAYYHTRITMYPEISLKRTQNVIALANKASKIRVGNDSTLIVTQGDNTIFSRTPHGTDYIQQVIRESEIKKDIIQTKNMKRQQRFDVTWRVTVNETYVDNEGLHYIFQENGKFYDLLPAGGILNTSSIKVSTMYEDLIPGEYTYEVIDNFRDTGRSMLVVSIAESTKDRYYLTYQTSHAYTSINDYGKNLLNSVAYESGNEKIGEGRADDGGLITDKETFTDLDPDTNAAKFLYAEARYSINILMAAATGLKKQVKNATENTYTYETTVHLNEGYSYQVRLANDATTKCKDIVFFDSLENFYQKKSETTPTIPSDWKGALTGVNINNLVFKGISPVVYLSKLDCVNIQNHHDLEETVKGEPVWMEYNDFVATYGLDKATAIAVDASRKLDGSDFVMQEKESISFDIYMQAPEEDKTQKQDAIAYNNIYVARTAIVSDGETETEIPQFYHQDYTKTHFRVAGDVNLKKVDATDGTTPIKGITYQLSGTSDYGTVYQEERISNKNGDMLFETIEKGTYELREISCSDDWQLNTEIYMVTIDAKGQTKIAALSKQGDAFLVMDKPRIHADLTFLKYNNVTNAAVKGATFQLSGTSDYGNDYLLYATSNEIGYVSFENLELGTYELIETDAPYGYIQKKTPWKVKVDDRGVAILYDGDTEETKNTEGVYRVANEPYHSIRFVKSSTYGDNIYLEGAEFNLKGVSDYGTTVDMTETSGKAEDFGLVEFTGLEPGTYLLKETKAPAEHDIDDKTYTVIVRKDGTFTIEGLSKIQIGNSAAGCE